MWQELVRRHHAMPRISPDEVKCIILPEIGVSHDDVGFVLQRAKGDRFGKKLQNQTISSSNSLSFFLSKMDDKNTGSLQR